MKEIKIFSNNIIELYIINILFILLSYYKQINNLNSRFYKTNIYDSFTYVIQLLYIGEKSIYIIFIILIELAYFQRLLLGLELTFDP